MHKQAVPPETWRHRLEHGEDPDDSRKEGSGGGRRSLSPQQRWADGCPPTMSVPEPVAEGVLPAPLSGFFGAETVDERPGVTEGGGGLLWPLADGVLPAPLSGFFGAEAVDEVLGVAEGTGGLGGVLAD